MYYEFIRCNLTFCDTGSHQPSVYGTKRLFYIIYINVISQKLQQLLGEPLFYIMEKRVF